MGTPMTTTASSLAEQAHQFAEQEMRPVAGEYDQHGTWPQMSSSGHGNKLS